MGKARLAIFDCDGTLVDSQADIIGAMETAFAQQGLSPPRRSETRRIVGLSSPEAIRALAPQLSGDAVTALAEAYKQAYYNARQSGQLQEPLYDGIADLLHSLYDGGWMLAVATGKSDRGLHNCLTHHGIRDLFISLQTADRHPSKPHPSMLQQAMADAGTSAADSIVIGDTFFDIDMARAAGCKSIGVSWGYHEVEELSEAGADFIANDMAELRQHLESEG